MLMGFFRYEARGISSNVGSNPFLSSALTVVVVQWYITLMVISRRGGLEGGVDLICLVGLVWFGLVLGCAVVCVLPLSLHTVCMRTYGYILHSSFFVLDS